MMPSTRLLGFVISFLDPPPQKKRVPKPGVTLDFFARGFTVQYRLFSALLVNALHTQKFSAEKFYFQGILATTHHEW